MDEVKTSLGKVPVARAASNTGQQRINRRPVGDVELVAGYRKGRLDRRRVVDVGKRQVTNGVSTDLAALAERAGEFLADHAPTADDNYTHGLPLVLAATHPSGAP
jgi:hypothetical protein